MRVLITGAQGFVGRYLAGRWLDADPEVEITGCGRSAENSRTFLHNVTIGSSSQAAALPPGLRAAADSTRYTYCRVDVADRKCMTDLLNEFRPAVIVHLASGLRDDHTEHLLRTNVAGTEQLYQAIADSNTRPYVICGSSGSVYGAVAEPCLPIQERVPPEPFDMYSITKVAQEHVARMLARRLEVPTIVTRIFNIAGPGQDERHFCGHLASQIVAIERQRCPAVLSVGPLTTTRDFIDVRDVANGLILIASVRPDASTCNLASGRETAMQEIFDRMLALSRIQGEVSIERRPGRKADMPRNVASMEVMAAWGFRPAYDLSETLSDVLEYYRSLPDNG